MYDKYNITGTAGAREASGHNEHRNTVDCNFSTVFHINQHVLADTTNCETRQHQAVEPLVSCFKFQVPCREFHLQKSGFTLIELLIAMVISTVVAAGIFSAFRSQQSAYLGQKQIVEMEQNLRAAMYMVTGEIRMAGYDPDNNNGAGITRAGDGSNKNNLLGFTIFNGDAGGDGSDNDNDGVKDESGETLQAIEYYLYDSGGDGDKDFGRRYGARLDAIAENIKRLEFEYLDASGSVMAAPLGSSDLADIRSIRVTIEATIDKGKIDYTNGKNRTLTTLIKCRNLGL